MVGFLAVDDVTTQDRSPESAPALVTRRRAGGVASAPDALRTFLANVERVRMCAEFLGGGAPI